MLQTIALDLPTVLPQNPDCRCCASHLVEALRDHGGVASVRLDAAVLILEVDPQIVAESEVEQLACATGLSVAQRYDHPMFAVEGMDCTDCARTIERAIARLDGIHYANVNFAAAQLYLEYDREYSSI